MSISIERLTLSDLDNRIDEDQEESHLKRYATLFCQAMNDWPSLNQNLIVDFVKGLYYFYGTPLTSEKIRQKAFSTSGHNAWRHEAGESIAVMLDLSMELDGVADFDVIVKNIQDYCMAGI